VSLSNLRWTERFAFLSELLDAPWDRWEGFAPLLTELARNLGFARLDLRLPAEGASPLLHSSAAKREDFSVSPEQFQQLHGKSESVLVDPQDSTRRMVLVRFPGNQHALLRGESNDWSAENEALLKHLASVLGKSPAVIHHLGLSLDRRQLIDRLNDGALLAGRLAHDYDNLWTGIVGFAELTLPALKLGSNEQQYIQEVATIGQRGISMTAQLHQFSRSGAIKPMPSSVGMVLNREHTRLKQTSNGRIRWSIDVPPDLPSVAIEAGAMQVVLGHLLDNAVESMTNSGSLKIEAETVELNHAEALRYLGDVRAGENLRLKITDSGSGIKDDVKTKLFHQPFFTTKPRHRGLGLAIVYRTLFVHRGGLTIESEVGKGTTLQVVLPLTASPTLTVGSNSDRTTHTTNIGAK
jgi:signal transduction histidine kinase